MKQCPFCRAEIQENARFCLYCMRSLEDKQPAEEARQYDRRWIVMIAVPIAAIILAVGIWALVRRPSTDPSVGSDAMTESADTSDSPRGSGAVTTVKTTAKRGSGTAATTRGNNGGAGKITTAKVKTTTRAIATQPSVTSSTTADTHKNNAVPSGESTSSKETASYGESTSTEKITSSEETTSSEEGTSSAQTVTSATTAPDVTYLYRDARRGDDFYANATLENAVVITGVSTPSQDGTYVIPDTLDGKTVVAIMGFAFSDDNVRDTVKQVVVPAGVKTIWNYAFAECGQMSDIYFCGDAIYTEAFAFADVADRVGTLTIHCAASCNDRNFRYYKTNASNYDALYEEWNG